MLNRTPLALAIAGMIFTLTGMTPAQGRQHDPNQNPGSIEGTVTLATDGTPLHGATVLMIGPGRSTLTDESGHFSFSGLAPAEYEILATREHLQAARLRVTIMAGQVTRADLSLTLLSVHEEVTVTATGRETTAFDAFNSVQVLDSVDLARNMAGTLGEILENESGIAKRSFGPGSSRPIIRGFDNDRVLIMQDGVRSGDLSSQSSDHGSSIDPAGLQKIEVLKGPATLLYGSNAIGGVVNTITPQQQFYGNPPAELRGAVNSDLATTNDQAGLNANFQYGSGRFMAWFGGGGRRTGDYGTPEGPVANTQTRQGNGRAGLGWFGDTGWISGSYQLEDGIYGVPSVADDEPSVDLDTRREVLRADTGLRNLGASFVDEIKAIVSHIDWRHNEIEKDPVNGTSEIGTRFSNRTTIARLEAQQHPTSRLTGQFGLWGQHRDYRSTGEEALAPRTLQKAVAGFGYEEITFDRFSVQLGARIESNAYRPDERTGSNEAPAVRDRDFTGLSGSAGIRVPLADNRAALVASLGSSYRAPALEELYNFGPHVGNLAFEIGNPDLGRERSNGGEISLRLNSATVHGQANFFYYDIGDFIFTAPTGQIREGFVELQYAQGDARYVGADLSLSFHLSQAWRLHASGGYVNARLKGSNEPLPRIPPLSGRLAIDWLPTNALQLRPELVFAARQDRTFRTETPTAGYALLNLSASYTLARSKIMHIVTLKATNLSNVLYRNHSSLIKDFAPEPGRRLLLTYALRIF